MFKIKTTQLLNFLISKLEKWRSKLQKKEEERVDMPLHALTPVIFENDATYNYYEQALKWAIQQEDCKNIALSGIYGSGKSSIINTFIKNSDSKHLNISLGSFENKKIGQDELNSVEKSIIQQILFTVDESKIPNSNLKRIKTTNKLKLRGQYVKVLAIIGLIYLLFNLQVLCLTWFSFLYDSFFVGTHVLILLIIAIITWSYFKKSTRIIGRIGVEKLNLKNGEISLKDSPNKSILNEYVDELIYFFTENKIDIVVFEDLDRFNNLSIFSTLRELNLLINKNETIKKKGRVIFLYAVKEDLFKDEDKNERVKFFDFILPVISVINSSNSYAKLKELLGEGELKDLSDEFLQDISLYINDLRLLKNICNEYLTFKQLIKDNVELPFDPNKLLAMAIYKNYFPKDYNELILDKGNLYYLLSKAFKDRLIENKVSQLDTKINELNVEINDLNGKLNLNQKEIQMMYLNPLINALKARGMTNIVINGKLESFEKIDYNHLEIIYSTSILCRSSNGRNETVKNDFKSLEINGVSYNDRIENESKKLQDTFNKKTQLIQNYTNEKRVLEKNDLSKLVIKKTSNSNLFHDVSAP